MATAPVVLADAVSPLAQAVAAHCERLRVETRAPKASLVAATSDLARFTEFAATRGLTDPAQVDVHAVRAWVAHRRRQGLAAASVRRELSTLRSFFRGLNRLGELEHNPVLDVRAPKAPRKLPASFEKEPLNAAMDALAGDAPHAARDQVLLELLYGCGLRLGELQGLTLGQLGGDHLRVHGKGGKTRLLPLGRKARAALDTWLPLRAADFPAANGAEAPLFPGRDGGAALSKGTIARALKRWAQRTSLAGRVHPHRFRHAFATHLLEESGDLRGVQELLGHANLSTTQIYTHLDFERLLQVYDGAHPRSRRPRGTPFTAPSEVATQPHPAGRIVD